MVQDLPHRGPGRPPDPLARGARSARVLAAARAVFARAGFHAATTRDIAATAGVSVANLYQLFPAKEDIVAAIVAEDLAADLARVQVVADAADPVAAIHALMTGPLGETASTTRLRFEIVAEAARNPAVTGSVATAEATILAALTAALAHGQSRGAIRLGDPPVVLAALLICLVDGWFTYRTLDALPKDHGVADALRDMLARMLRP